MQLDEINEQLKTQSPKQIIEWALKQAKNPVVTTNFRPYEAAILHATSQQSSRIKVIWCDTGYNTRNTYVHAQTVIKQLDLNVHLYVPMQTSAYRDVVLGIPEIDTEEHDLFTEQVKLEPFRRAMKEHTPDLWFTNLRKGQTAFRDSIDIVSQDKEGRLKVAPFFNWTDSELDEYLLTHHLPNEHTYYDPTKVISSRECGLHS